MAWGRTGGAPECSARRRAVAVHSGTAPARYALVFAAGRADCRHVSMRASQSAAVDENGASSTPHPTCAGRSRRCRNCIQAPESGRRPIRAVLLTDAELDHTIGLLMLRQSTELEVYATEPVLRTLEDAFPLRRVLSSIHGAALDRGDAWVPTLLDGGRLRPRVPPFSVRGMRQVPPPATATRRRDRLPVAACRSWILGSSPMPWKTPWAGPGPSTRPQWRSGLHRCSRGCVARHVHSSTVPTGRRMRW